MVNDRRTSGAVRASLVTNDELEWARIVLPLALIENTSLREREARIYYIKCVRKGSSVRRESRGLMVTNNTMACWWQMGESARCVYIQIAHSTVRTYVCCCCCCRVCLCLRSRWNQWHGIRRLLYYVY